MIAADMQDTQDPQDAHATMPFDDLELAYELLAQAIDKAGAAHESLFLTRLALVLAHRGGNLKLFEDAVTTALEELAEPSTQPT